MSEEECPICGLVVKLESLICGHFVCQGCLDKLADVEQKCPISKLCRAQPILFEGETRDEALVRLRSELDLLEPKLSAIQLRLLYQLEFIDNDLKKDLKAINDSIKSSVERRYFEMSRKEIIKGITEDGTVIPANVLPPLDILHAAIASQGGIKDGETLVEALVRVFQMTPERATSSSQSGYNLCLKDGIECYSFAYIAFSPTPEGQFRRLLDGEVTWGSSFWDASLGVKVNGRSCTILYDQERARLNHNPMHWSIEGDFVQTREQNPQIRARCDSAEQLKVEAIADALTDEELVYFSTKCAESDIEVLQSGIELSGRRPLPPVLEPVNLLFVMKYLSTRLTRSLQKIIPPWLERKNFKIIGLNMGFVVIEFGSSSEHNHRYHHDGIAVLVLDYHGDLLAEDCKWGCRSFAFKGDVYSLGLTETAVFIDMQEGEKSFSLQRFGEPYDERDGIDPKKCEATKIKGFSAKFFFRHEPTRTKFRISSYEEMGAKVLSITTY